MPEDRDALVEKALDAYECEKNRWQVTPVERSIYDKDGRPAYSTYLFVRGPFVGLARYHSAAVPEAESFERFEASAIHKESVPHEAAMQAAIASILPPTTSAGDAQGWLVETDFGPHTHYIGLCDPHDYWREQREKGRSVHGRGALVGIIRFCKDANDACRFARKEDAQQLVEALGQLLTEPRICEHMWPTPSAGDGELTVPDQIARVMSHKWLDPECGEGGCQSLRWKRLYEDAVKGRQDFRAAYREARARVKELEEALTAAEAKTREEDARIAEKLANRAGALAAALSRQKAAGDAMADAAKAVAWELERLRAIVRGESPSLLDDYDGGSIPEIDGKAAIERARAALTAWNSIGADRD